MEKINNKQGRRSKMIAVITQTGTRTETRINLLHKVFLGTCYLVGVLGIGLILTLTLVTWPQGLEKNVLVAAASSNSVTLSWTAPGDDNASGWADHYEIRYATFIITADNFSSATLVPNPPVPKIAGSSETFEVTGLEPDTLYYFALKTADEVPSWSALSNVVSKRTAPVYVCSPSWSCTAWSACQAGLKTRQCIDLNNCGTNEGKPTTSQVCVVPPCTESWSCTPWSVCVSGYHTRTCTDKNKCGTTVSKPATRSTCKPPTVPCLEDWSCGSWSDCQDSLQSRECFDISFCGTTNNKPETSRSCVMPVCRESWSCTDWSDCSRGFQRRVCQDIYDCGTTANKPKEIIECAVGGQEPVNPQSHFLAVTPASHSGPQVRLFDRKLNIYSQFFAYPQEYRKGVNTAIGDVDGDGLLEIVTGTGPDSPPQLKVFSLKGVLKYQLFAYPAAYRIGISVAAGDVNGDGRAEIITAPQDKGGPHIRVFQYSPTSKKFTLYKQFFAYPANFRMGVNVVAGDLNGDDRAEIIVAPRNVGGPHVRVYQYNSVKAAFNLRFQFFAYAFGFRGGVNLAVGDVDNNGKNEIITGAGPGGGPHVRVFSNKGTLKYQFFPAKNSFRGGVDVAAFDYNQDGADEVVTGTYTGAVPGVKIFKWLGGNNFQQKAFFYAFDPRYLWGIRVEGY